MKYTFLLGIWLFFSTSLQAQNILVLEQDTNLPLAGVLIYNTQKTKTATTDIDGHANIDKFSLDEDIHFQHMFHKKAHFTKSVILSNKNIVYLLSKIEDLNEVVISASKFEQSKRDIPQKIINISAKSIQFSNPQTSADLLESSGNIYVQKRGLRESK